MKSHLSIIHLPSLRLEVKTNPGSFTGVGVFFCSVFSKSPFPRLLACSVVLGRQWSSMNVPQGRDAIDEPVGDQENLIP